jgi:hypothetical protein
MIWPDGKRFAFTIFDDPDSQSIEASRIVYGFLAGLGFRTTKGVWPLAPLRETNSRGDTCGSAAYLEHCRELQRLGFEIGFHNATPHSAVRVETEEALDLFREYFGAYPETMANHYNEEAIYWGDMRLTGPRRRLYNLVTLYRKSGKHFGHVKGHRTFWGDLCRQRIRYCRNFVYAHIDTLQLCPWMPYTDPERPFVNAWYAATEGAIQSSFVSALREGNQDRLEASGGACIMYTHFGHGFVREGKLEPRFRDLMTRLSRKEGWFVPLSVVLDYLAQKQGVTVLQPWQRRRLETRWLLEKLVRGTS